MKKTLLLLLAILLPVLASAYDAYVGGIYYNFSGSYATVTSGPNKYAGAVSIEGTVYYSGTRYTVNSIGSNAFYDCRSLTSVSIPTTVTKIGASAFLNCLSLSSVNIPSSVTSIGDGAFSTCTSLTSITLPDGLTSLPLNLFNGSGLKSFTIPSSVTTIGNQAFRECKSLTSISIPNKVTTIGTAAFMHCTSLPSIIIPSSVTSIGDWAFRNCENLTLVRVGMTTIPAITEETFSNRANATLVVPEGNENAYKSAAYWKEFKVIVSDKVTIGNLKYKLDWDNFTASVSQDVSQPNSSEEFYTVTIPASFNVGGNMFSVTSIGNYAFNNKIYLASVDIPGSVTSIGYLAFSGCNGLKSITIPNSVTFIEESAFRNCMKLETVVLSERMYSISASTFENCLSLTSIVIPNSVICIKNHAFSHCTSLSSIVIPNSVTSIEQVAFGWCESLTSITIPKSVTSIGEAAFANCNNLTTVFLGINTPLTIKESTFSNRANATLVVPEGCVDKYKAANYWKDFKEIIEKSQTIIVDDIAYELDWNDFTATVIAKEPKYEGNIEIPASIALGNLSFDVTSIKPFTFAECSNLTSVTIPNTVTVIEEGLFLESGLTSVTLPNSITSIGDSAFDGCTNLTSVNIPESVTGIGDYAFSGCTNLTSVNIPSSVTSIKEEVFWHCSSLTSIIIPEGVTSIGKRAFAYSGLKHITIPSTLTSIGNFAFEGCSSLQTIWCDAVTPPTVSDYSFELVNVKKVMLVVPDNSINAYKYHPFWKQFWIETPTGIRQIDNGQQTTDNGLQIIYNLAGQRLNKMQKGINIIDGRKVLVK